MKTAGVVCLFVVTFAAAAQEQQKYSEQVEVRIRNLDVIVNDKKGNAVRGLKKEDFIVLEAGVEQDVTNFAFYDSGAKVAANFEATVENVPGAAELLPPPRRFMFFIDDMAIQGSARATLKKHALEIVRTMRPGDVATIVRPTGSKRILQDYSGDVAQIEKILGDTIDECKIRVNAPAFAELRAFRRAMEVAYNDVETANAKREYAEAEEGRVRHRLAQIRALLASMARADGKKVFVLITSGLSAQPGRAAYEFNQEMKMSEKPDTRAQERAQYLDEDAAAAGGPGSMMAQVRIAARMAQPNVKWSGMDRPEFGDFREQIDELARSAAADGVTIYALEPEVPLMLHTNRGADSKDLGSTVLENHLTGRNVVPPQMLEQLLHYEGQTLTSLTEKTGGRWFRGVGAIDDTFKQMADDLRTYYSLAYRPRGDERAIRKIQVKVRNRPELVVRTRTEVVDQPQARDMSQRVIAGLLYPNDEDSLQMTVKAARATRRGRQYEIPVEVVIPTSKLTFHPAQDGTYRALVNVHYATARDDKELLTYGQVEQIVELSRQQYAALSQGRYRYHGTLKVPKGAIRIAFGVIDASTRHASRQTVEVMAK